MPYFKLFVPPDQVDQLAQLARAYACSPATLLRPYISGNIRQLWHAYTDPSSAELHQKIIVRALEAHNTTLTELSHWTGLDRAIIQTTLNELLETDRIRENRGRGKIINYFLNK